MPKAGILAGTLFALAGLSPASAQSWGVGVGVEFGGPGYYGPPPVIYAPPPAYVYEEEAPPVIYMPAPTVVPSAVPPNVVFDSLERAGYRELGPMAFRDGFYKLNAVNRHGDLVALEVSLLTGAVQREYVLQRGRRVDAPPPLPPGAEPPRVPGGDPLVVY